MTLEPAPRSNGDPPNHPIELGPGEERVIELREEQLVANKQLRDLGEIIVRTEVDTAPARLEVDALREEVEVVHEPVGDAVSERHEAWEEDGVLIVPIYESSLSCRSGWCCGSVCACAGSGPRSDSSLRTP